MTPDPIEAPEITQAKALLPGLSRYPWALEDTMVMDATRSEVIGIGNIEGNDQALRDAEFVAMAPSIVGALVTALEAEREALVATTAAGESFSIQASKFKAERDRERGVLAATRRALADIADGALDPFASNTARKALAAVGESPPPTEEAG